jgi:hypothetical protein
VRSVRTNDGAAPLTGFVLCALAFSTLLSSQGADAHLRQTLVRLQGNRLNLPGEVPFVNSVRQNFADSWPCPAVRVASTPDLRAQHEVLAGRTSWWRRRTWPAFASIPWRQEEPYGCSGPSSNRMAQLLVNPGQTRCDQACTECFRSAGACEPEKKFQLASPTSGAHHAQGVFPRERNRCRKTSD